MDTVGVVSEYNPFHKGHKFQLDEIKRISDDASIVCIMSPNFVQRGEPALFDKYARGRCAVDEGADLAVSMPLVHALLSAEGFAESGIHIAKRLGVTHLAFGVEDDDLSLLTEVANALTDSKFDIIMKEETEKHPSVSYATLREKAVLSLLGERAANIIKTPNNILAVEYLKAIKKFAPDIKPLPIKRKGNAYHDESETGEILSATSIRKISKSGGDFLSHLPDAAREVLGAASPFNYEKYENFLYSVIISKSSNILAKYTGNSELANIIKNSAEKYTDFRGFRTSLSRRKHPETKIDRTLVNLLLDVEYDVYMHKEPEYITLLAMNERGRRIVSRLRHSDGAVIMSRGADFKKHALASAEKEVFADSIYARCMTSPEEGSWFIKKKPYTKEGLK